MKKMLKLNQDKNKMMKIFLLKFRIKKILLDILQTHMACILYILIYILFLHCINMLIFMFHYMVCHCFTTGWQKHEKTPN